ncbi:MAG: SPASM domain-containing protein [Deltaproteobacteria bacterium]|nr:SPASM domain-containing protein [Deltaproteobacteria bacterium]
MWDKIKRVTFELSNVCNFADQHAKCPLHDHADGVRHLPELWVELALVELGDHDFNGRLAFHNYCEPMLDPRLFSLIDFADCACPDARVFIMTNGWNLSQQLLDDLCRRPNVKQVEVTAYTDLEGARLRGLTAPEGVDLRVARHGLDDRLNWYGRDLIDLGPDSKCDSPFGAVVVRCTGDIALCCFDWATSITFGNLKDGLGAFVDSPRAKKVYRDLMSGRRDIPICKRCGIDKGERGSR